MDLVIIIKNIKITIIVFMTIKNTQVNKSYYILEK